LRLAPIDDHPALFVVVEAPPPMVKRRHWWEGTAWLGGGRNGGAVLRVASGVATIEVNRLLKLFTGLKRVEKHGGTVLVSRVRVRAPWMSTVIRLDRRTSFTVGFRARRRVTEALRSEGFVVEEERVWLRPTRSGDFEDGDRVPA
jgi:hypothetical protein